MSTYEWPPGGSGSAVPTYANLAAFPSAASAGDGALAIALDTHYLYESTGAAWVVIGGPSSVLTVGTIDTGTPSDNGAQIVLNELIMQSASATKPGLVNITTQSFAGNKTFTGTIGASNLSGTNTGNVTLTAVGAVPNANGASLSGQALTLQPANTSFPGVLLAADWNTFNGKQAAGNYITALTGDGTASGPGSAALTLATVNSNVGSFGSVANSVAFTVNAKGLITAASATAIQIAESQVTNLVSDLAGKQATGNYITALTGDVAASGPGSVAATIQPGVIVNSMVNASAAIAYSKLNLTGSIVNADVNASAAIVYSKLSLTGGIVNADVNASAAIAYSKLNLSASIVNADVASGAAIAVNKLAALTASRVVITDGSGFISAADTTTYPTLTELSYVKGVTSAIQTQITAKMTNPMTTAGDIIYGGASGAPTRLAGGTTSYVLQSSGATNPPSWAPQDYSVVGGSVLKFVGALISYSAGTPSVTTSYGGTWISSITDVGTGQSTLNLGAVFSAAPCPTVAGTESASSGLSPAINATTSTSIAVRTRDLGATLTDGNYYIMAIGYP